MADHLHYSTREFRDILLAELSKLEYGIREHLFNAKGLAQAQVPALAQAHQDEPKHDHEVKKLRKELAEYKELNDKLTQAASNSTIVNDLEKQVEELNRQLKKAQQENKALQSTCISKAEYDAAKAEIKNIELGYVELNRELEQAKSDNKLLKTSYSEAQGRIKELEKENEGLKEELEVVKKLTAEKAKVENKNIIVAEPEEEEEVEEEEEETDPATFPSLKHKGKVYKQAPDNTLYLETEEGWEEVGIWDPKTKTIVEAEVEEEEEAEAEEEEPNFTEFQYKGKIYFLDEENNVYKETEEGYEEVGKWNGKKILFE